MAEMTTASLSTRFLRAKEFVGIGVYDGLSALLASQHGFDFLWLGSFSVSAALGVPDIGIIGPEHVSNVLRSVREASALPIAVDLDAGYGDPLKLHYVVQQLVTVGANALCIEDNPTAKRCSLYEGIERVLVPTAEHEARVRAARAGVDAVGGDCVVVARTEALVAGLGMQEALARSNAYVDAGADAIFVQSVDASAREIMEFAALWKRRTPVLVTPTRYFRTSRTALFSAGLSHVIYANHAIRAAHCAMRSAFEKLSQLSSSAELEDGITTVAQLASDVGKARFEELEARFSSAPPGNGDD